ncbi:hypothetical protein LEP1GSC124_3699 [Leptospira interrogans serovar Pyrogenes str. 200701872]|uniref:Uncharacterized protein n=1 Tax=Leptospira interrogans serovar Pyrogenes str. 200701872 TaxID=1193029 RepID=M7A475_LEPIR|nr:hypothetical protein LEP1GSC124_3699 [Leptospira interrogans serovar Pyrogenes str. 200701872]
MRNYELTTITRVSSREVAKSEIQETLKKAFRERHSRRRLGPKKTLASD